jgi:hypothetical protein
MQDDPLWNLVGIGHSERGDVSTSKHQYLAEAYLHHRKQAYGLVAVLHLALGLLTSLRH